MIFEEREEYLYARLEADLIDLDTAIKYINELVTHLRETEHSKVLFVRETPFMVTEVAYTIVVGMLITLLPRDKMFAVVDQSPSHRIVKKVIHEEHHRHPSIDAFDSIEAAEEWLLTGKEEADNAPTQGNDVYPSDDPVGMTLETE